MDSWDGGFTMHSVNYRDVGNTGIGLVGLLLSLAGLHS